MSVSFFPPMCISSPINTSHSWPTGPSYISFTSPIVKSNLLHSKFLFNIPHPSNHAHYFPGLSSTWGQGRAYPLFHNKPLPCIPSTLNCFYSCHSILYLQDHAVVRTATRSHIVPGYFPVSY